MVMVGVVKKFKGLVYLLGSYRNAGNDVAASRKLLVALEIVTMVVKRL